MDDIDILKKDLAGRNKKIQKLIGENYVKKCKIEYLQDKLNEQEALNNRLYLKYMIAIKELAVYKSKEATDE